MRLLRHARIRLTLLGRLVHFADVLVLLVLVPLAEWTDTMITITEAAEAKIAELVAQSEKPVRGLRIGASLDAATQVDYKLAFISTEQIASDDQTVSFDGFNVFMDPDSAEILDEARVDYVDGLMGSGFKIERPRKMPAHLSGPMAETVHRVIETQINPGVASHGGIVTLVDIKEQKVFVQLGGGGQGCGQADVTLKEGIVRMIKEAVPEVEEVVDATDHESGENPYY